MGKRNSKRIMSCANPLLLLLSCFICVTSAFAQEELTREDVREMEKEYLFDVACSKLCALSEDKSKPITAEQFHEAVAPLVEEGSIAEGQGLCFAGVQALYLDIPVAGIPYLRRAIDEYPNDIVFETTSQSISDVMPFWLSRLQRGAGCFEAAIETYRRLGERGGHIAPISRLLIAEILSDSLQRKNDALRVLEEVCAQQSQWAPEESTIESGPFGEAKGADIDTVYCHWARCEQARLRGNREAQYYSAEGQAGAYMAFYDYLYLTGLMGFTSKGCSCSSRTRWMALSNISRYEWPCYLVTYLPFGELFNKDEVRGILERNLERDNIFGPFLGFSLRELLRRQGEVAAAEALHERLKEELLNFF